MRAYNFGISNLRQLYQATRRDAGVIKNVCTSFGRNALTKI